MRRAADGTDVPSKSSSNDLKNISDWYAFETTRLRRGRASLPAKMSLSEAREKVLLLGAAVAVRMQFCDSSKKQKSPRAGFGSLP